jgi:hypothetical protein
MTDVVLLERDSVVALQRVGVADRVRARLRAAELDRRLAAGAAPESGPELMLRARRLLRRSERRRLARTLRALVRAAAHPRPGPATPPLARKQVLESAGELERLAATLDATGPVSVRGIALVRLLLTDGSGPLYLASRGGRLESAIESVLAYGSTSPRRIA